MLFESRGMHKIMAELTRIEHLEIIIKNSINNFISEDVYNHTTKITHYAINKFNIKEDEIETHKCIIRDNVVRMIMRYQHSLINTISDFYSEGTISERINNLQKALRSDKELFESLKYLQKLIFSLDRYFEKKVIEEIEDKIEEHITDINDVQLGKAVKTIEQKRIELKKEHAIKMKEHEEISRINSSYWSDYEDSIREVRGLDKDCPIF